MENLYAIDPMNYRLIPVAVRDGSYQRDRSRKVVSCGSGGRFEYSHGHPFDNVRLIGERHPIPTNRGWIGWDGWSNIAGLIERPAQTHPIPRRRQDAWVWMKIRAPERAKGYGLGWRYTIAGAERVFAETKSI